MTDLKKTAPRAADPVPEKAPELASASESLDGAIQQLCALRHTHVMNGDSEAADAITAQLASLGYK